MRLSSSSVPRAPSGHLNDGEARAGKKWQLLRGKRNTSDRRLRFVTSQKADGALRARFRAPRGSSSLTGTHPSFPPLAPSSYLVILFCTSLA